MPPKTLGVSTDRVLQHQAKSYQGLAYGYSGVVWALAQAPHQPGGLNCPSRNPGAHLSRRLL